ncbi:hypothetical protein BASA81_007993 [Batrachochytrium salamandrivorans]|nr:hypothetical protein BASA81_007993 [Batrachochytrium salamandrivorans]
MEQAAGVGLRPKKSYQHDGEPSRPLCSTTTRTPTGSTSKATTQPFLKNLPQVCLVPIPIPQNTTACKMLQQPNNTRRSAWGWLGSAIKRPQVSQCTLSRGLIAVSILLLGYLLLSVIDLSWRAEYAHTKMANLEYELVHNLNRINTMDARAETTEKKVEQELSRLEPELVRRVGELESLVDTQRAVISDLQAELNKVFNRLRDFEGRIYKNEHELNVKRDAVFNIRGEKELVDLHVDVQTNLTTIPIPTTTTTAAAIREESYQDFIPFSKLARPAIVTSNGIQMRTTSALAFTGECAKGEREWEVCDLNDGRSPVNLEPAMLKRLPLVTKWGEPVSEFTQRVLHKAWGSTYPVIDLYVRASRESALTLRYLWKTVDLFWPSFLGEIILVMDVGDEAYADALLPHVRLHNFHVVYEHVNCMSSGLFIPYSYLNLHRRTQAEYVVAIDSNSLFIRPVTPNVLFSLERLPIFSQSLGALSAKANISPDFQDKLERDIVSQPVLLKPQTLLEYAEWVKLHRPTSECLEKEVSAFYRLGNGSGAHLKPFCWQCQIAQFLINTNTTEYSLFEQSATQFAINSPQTAEEIILQGLCQHLGNKVFDECYSVVRSSGNNLAEDKAKLDRVVTAAMEDKLLLSPLGIHHRPVQQVV